MPEQRCPSCNALMEEITDKNSLCFLGRIAENEILYVSGVPTYHCQNLQCGAALRTGETSQSLLRMVKHVRSLKKNPGLIEIVAYDSKFTCPHDDQKDGVCDVHIQSKNNVLVMDVPCKICQDCGEIVSAVEHQNDAIEVASLGKDESWAALIAELHNTADRKDWDGLLMRYRKPSAES